MVKVNGQAVVFVNLFGSAAFQAGPHCIASCCGRASHSGKVMLKGFDYINGLVTALGPVKQCMVS